MRVIVLLLALSAGSAAAAQVQSRPTDAPQVTAANEGWYQRREPIPYAGEVYYPAGATVFFNGNHMVRSGYYNGIPLYADATLEPYSVVYVPVSRGQLQPYERRRHGDLAGTTGSRTPSFPVQMTPELTGMTAAAVPPIRPPMPAGAIGVYPRESTSAREVRTMAGVADATTPVAVGTSGVIAARETPRARGIVSLDRPQGNDGVWVGFLGEKWVSAGAAVPYSQETFARVGEYGSFPVFARRGLQEDMIYIPTRAGFVAPYRLKE